ncbi:hypothetical protein GCM10010274_31950 [Streptomyces lavendofoliae]|uniref:Uncharacterized protein n=2 Tax=Streptomyces lavendofoliae TaxID=67314 RepID=A0A918HY39_9ACTN|nr:hypothetical protein GCM10010274_31950 [Streptomyces lavendofoliae]
MTVRRGGEDGVTGSGAEGNGVDRSGVEESGVAGSGMRENGSGRRADGADAADGALMAILLGEPVPEGADAGTRARYAAAAGDVRVLRAQVRLIGDALAGEVTGGGPAVPGAAIRPAARRWRPRTWVLAASVAVLVSAAGVGVLRVAAGGEDEGAAKLSSEGVVACARVIAEGTVARAEPDGERTRVVLAVDRYLKPARGPEETEFSVPREEAAFFGAGERILVSISRFPDEPVLHFTGAEVATTREWMQAALPASRGMACDSPG